MDHARWRRLGLLPLLLLAACSENFGPPPPDGSTTVSVAREGFTGPVLARSTLSGQAEGGAYLLGTDAGVYRVVAGRWSPFFSGFVSREGNSRLTGASALLVDGPLRLVASDLGGGPMVSPDGGLGFQQLDLPDPVIRGFEAAGILPATAFHPLGAWLVTQGARIFVRDVGAEGWQEATFGGAPDAWGPVGIDATGRIAMTVREDGSDRIWSSSDGGRTFTLRGELPVGPVFAVGFDGPSLVWVDAEGLHGSGYDLVLEAGETITAARVRDANAVVVVTRRGDSRSRVFAPIFGVDLALDEEVVAASLGLGFDAAFVATASGDVLRLAGGVAETWEFGGGELGWFALGVREGAAPMLLLGQQRTGEIFEGSSEDSESFVSRAVPQLATAPRAILAEGGERILVGSFGVFDRRDSAAPWLASWTGQSSYLQIVFGGPVGVQTLFRDADDGLWLGALDGDGVYRSDDDAASWERVHAGLGAPGTREGEDGLPLAPQVRAFDEDPSGALRMAGFRSGVQRLDEDQESPVWVQENRGLPGPSGTPWESCCVDPDGNGPDVRDLVRLADGTLLAATGWGIFAFDSAMESWELRSQGLTNADVWAMAAHPTRARTVVAVGRGVPASPRWIHLSEDSGRTWFPVDVSVLAKDARDVVWSRPERMEITALLYEQGAWRMELRQ